VFHRYQLIKDHSAATQVNVSDVMNQQLSQSFIDGTGTTKQTEEWKQTRRMRRINRR
jgi:hypothetical protein